MSSQKKAPAARRQMRPAAKFLFLLVALFLMQVQLPIGGLLAALGTVALHPVGLGIAAAVTSAYLYFTKGTRR